MQFKIRMLKTDGRLKAGEIYWAEEFPSNPDWMFAENIRIPKYRANEMFEFVGISYVLPGKRVIYLNETNKGYEVYISGRSFHLDRGARRTIFLKKQNVYVILKYENNEVTYDLYENKAMEYA